MGTKMTNETCIHEEIKCSLNSGSTCYRSLQKLLSSHFLSPLHITIIFPLDFYWCETSSLILREGHRLRVFENRVLRRIFGSKREEVAGGWRRLHNEELHCMYTSPNIIRVIISKRMRRAGASHFGEMRNAYNILVGKPEGKRQIGKPKHRWEDNVRMDLGEIWSEDVD
jgi:hypothetical protein